MRIRALSAAAALLALPLASACVVSRVTVPSAPAIPAMSGNKAADAYDSEDVHQHFDVYVNRVSFRNTSKDAVSFSCVDSRSEEPSLGTPGGDIAEIMGAVYLYFKKTGVPLTKPAVQALITKYIDGLPGRRRFYFHQGDGAMRTIFSEVNAATGKRYITMPDVMPAGEEAAWMAALTKGANQGCGHIRLMIDRFADYGLPNADVPKFVLQSFYKYWWTTPVGSKRRSQVNFAILQGPLSGRAVAIVNPIATGNATVCLKGQVPAIATSHIGSQVFVYHQSAAVAYRNDIITPWFHKYAKSNNVSLGDLGAFKKDFNALHGIQLTSTLKYLMPVANLDTYQANLEISR